MPNKQINTFFDTMSRLGLMLTYDDVRLHTCFSKIDPSKTDVSTKLTRNIRMNIPIVSSPMDTVTQSRMAIALAENGGCGTIWRMPEPEEQARHVQRTKFRLNARLRDPITVKPNDIVSDVLKMREQKRYQFHTFPVVDIDSRLVGLVSGSDFDFCNDYTLRIRDIMTPLAQLTLGNRRTSPGNAYEIMRREKKKVLLLESRGRLVGMYTFPDLKRIFENEHGMFNVDSNGQLVVGAEIGVGKQALARAEILNDAHCDYFQIGVAHGASRNVTETIRELKKKYGQDLLVGNVSNGETAKILAKAGSDGITVGQGPGSICTTRVVAGIGVPQVSAVYDCVSALRGWDIPVCADGGINNAGDIVIALAIGASSVMLGRMLAGTDESPGETVLIRGMQMKAYRGMGSIGAMRESAAARERYRQGGLTFSKLVPEGIEGVVPYRGPVSGVLHQQVGGVRAGLGYNGARTLRDLRKHARIFRITNAGLNESHPHDVEITQEAPNYSGRS